MQDSQRTVRSDWQVGHVVAPGETNVSQTAQHVPRPSALSGIAARGRAAVARPRIARLPPAARRGARASSRARIAASLTPRARAARQRRPRRLHVAGQQRVDDAVAELVVEAREVRGGVALDQQLARVDEQVVDERALAVRPAAAVDLADLVDALLDHRAGRARRQAEEREEVAAEVRVVAQPRQLGQAA